MLTVTYRHDRFRNYILQADIDHRSHCYWLLVSGPDTYTDIQVPLGKFKEVNSYLISSGFSSVISG